MATNDPTHIIIGAPVSSLKTFEPYTKNLLSVLDGGF